MTPTTCPDCLIRVKYFHYQDLVRTLAAEVIPFMALAIHAVKCCADISPSDVVRFKEVILAGRGGVAEGKRVILDHISEWTPDAWLFSSWPTTRC